MAKKDDLANKIVELKARQEMDALEIKVLGPQVASAKKMQEDLEKTLRIIREQFEAATKAYATVRDSAKEKERDIKDADLEILALERELSRELDAESINERYLQEVEAFRQRCLDAPWRGENREDKRGAFSYQIEGAIHLAISDRAILGDKRGLGKSLTSIIYMDFVGTERAIIVCPSDTMGNYIREIKRWAPHRKCIQIGNMKPLVRDAMINVAKSMSDYVLVVNYEAWRKDDRLIDDLISLEADTLILDEAHVAKEWDSLTYKGIRKLAFGNNYCECGEPDIFIEAGYGNDLSTGTCLSCEKTAPVDQFTTIKHVLPMTGTPILNRPQEMFPMLHLVDPKNFKSEKDFLRDFCHKWGEGDGSPKWGWKPGGQKKLVEKVGPRFLARDRKSAGIVLPPLTEIRHVLPREQFMAAYPDQFEAYEQVRLYAQLLLDPDSDAVHIINNKITVLLRLRQVLTWPAAIELKVMDDEGNYLMSEHLDVKESWKVDKAEEMLNEFGDSGDRGIVFSQFKEPLHVIQRRLGSRAVVYDGTTPKWQKEEIQLDFDATTVGKHPKYDFVLANYKAGGTGLNFTAASEMILLDREWNPGKEDQASGRFDRIGQTRDTQLHHLHVERSVDTWLDGIIDEKADIIDGFEEEQSVYQSLYDSLRDGDI